MDEGKLWSFFRSILSQGISIEQDAQAGRYKSYEELSARLDAAARERLDEFMNAHAPTVSEGRS